MTRVLFVFAFVILLCQPPLPAQTTAHLSGEYLVSLVENTDARMFAGRLSPNASVERISRLLNLWRIRYTGPETETLSWLRRQPEVRAAQYNHLLENRSTVPNDPYFPQQWPLLNDGAAGGLPDADLDAEQAWEITTGGLTPAGDTIVLAVIDGGIDSEHPDLSPNLWHNWGEIPDNNLDDDLNGYVDDFQGWNVFSQNDHVQGFTAEHGTPVSGILGAKGNNNLGIAGINWDTKIMFIAASGTEAEVLAAYDYVLQARQRYNASQGEKGAFVVAVNCSWGINFGQPDESPLWCAAFDSLGTAGIVSVAATANIPQNVDEIGDLPTACPSNFLISVTNLDKADQKAANAAWGLQHVDLGAYGQDVPSTAWGSGYNIFAGTSFAAPQVTAAIGLLYASPCPNLIAMAETNPANAAYWAKSLVLENAQPNPSLAAISATGGRLNLYETLRTYQTQCGACPAPFSMKISNLTDASVTIQWSAPTVALGAKLRWRAIGSSNWMYLQAANNAHTLSGLLACTEYEIEVQTLCDKGESSAWSAPVLIRTQGCCTKPGSIWVESAEEKNAKIAWEAGSYDNLYRLRFRKEGNMAWAFEEVVGNATELQNLEKCTTYEVQVQSRCAEWVTDFSPLLNFKTKGCGACNETNYCLAVSNDATEEWIEMVQIGTWFHVSGAGGNGYQNFGTGQPIHPTLIAGYSVPVFIEPGFLGGQNKEYFRIFVDYNQDGDFDDLKELALDPGFAFEGNLAAQINVPSTLVPGITRLRVIMKFASPNDPPPSPCENFEFGQVEDYCVEIRLDTAVVHANAPVPGALAGFRAYPQPAREGLFLEFPEDTEADFCEIAVFDLAGRAIAKQKPPLLGKGIAYLNVSAWPAGAYLLQVRYGAKTLRGKVIKL